MTTEQAIAASYDEVLYPSDPVPSSHPDRLASVARLFGMRPAPVDRCRVLELGCGTGGNLLPMADRHPGSSFVGVELSARQVQAARQSVELLGLENIKFEHLSIKDLSEDFGRFDYVIAHGLFSWVSCELQEKIFSICRANLAPNGIAYLSYNTFPAWHLRGVFREISRHRTSTWQPAVERLAQLRQSLEFLESAFDGELTPYGKFMKDDVAFVLSQPDDYLAHEYLEEENRPVYFHDFAARATTEGLQYVGDASIPMMFSQSLGPLAEQHLAPYAADLTSFEQHMDALWNRSMRHSLLCHAGVTLSRQMTGSHLEGLRFAAQLSPGSVQPSLASSTSETFITENRVTLSSQSPTAKAALYELAVRWPGALGLEELVAAATARLRTAGRTAEFTAEERGSLANHLLQCLVSGIAEPRSSSDTFVVTVSQTPRANRLALVQARTSPRVTNRRHQMVMLDEVSQNLLAHLDGRHDREALSRVVREAMDAGRLSIFRGGIPIQRGQLADEILEKVIEQSLENLAHNALLVA